MAIKLDEGNISENMAANTTVSKIYEASSKLAKFPFEPYWTEAKLKICVTGAGGFIARLVTLNAQCVASKSYGLRSQGSHVSLGSRLTPLGLFAVISPNA